MKQLIAGAVIIFVVGLGAFFYRNIQERQPVSQGPQACTAEAKICPDGTAVGRTGADCAFAVCPLPNVEITNLKLAFALPTGYTQAPATAPVLSRFQKPSLSPSVQHVIEVRQYPIPEGQTAEQVIVSNTRFQPADMNATSIDQFSRQIINGKTYYSVVIERFEGQVESAYFLPRTNDVIRFDVIERDVVEWTNPDLVISKLPEHTALALLLTTLQSAE